MSSDIGDTIREALYDDALLERAMRESANDIPPDRPKGYGITAKELAEHKGCTTRAAREWLKANGYKQETMHAPLGPLGRVGAVTVFTKSKEI